jgi:hypothetical protein
MHLFLDVKKIAYIDEIDLFWFVNPFKSCLLPSLRQTLQSHITLPEFGEARTLSELFLVEEQSIRILVNMISEPNGGKASHMSTSTIVCLKS